jgi:hypothetical protein
MTTAPAHDPVQQRTLRHPRRHPGPRRGRPVRRGRRRRPPRRGRRGLRAPIAGLGGTFQVLGTRPCIAIPMTSPHRRPRPPLRPGPRATPLAFDSARSASSSAGVIRNFPLLLAASVLFGGATAIQQPGPVCRCRPRAPHAPRASTSVIVVWATTIGSASLGPNLVGPSEPVARALGLPLLTGPVPLLARWGWPARHRSSCSWLPAARPAASRPGSRLGGRRRRLQVAAQGLGDAGPAGPAAGSPQRAPRRSSPSRSGTSVMVSVMVMTPAAHERHGARRPRPSSASSSASTSSACSPSRRSPAWCVDRFGGRAGSPRWGRPHPRRRPTLLASASPEGESSTLLTLGLFLLGLGLVVHLCRARRPCSLAATVTPPDERPGAQGASDLLMGLVAAGGGARSPGSIVAPGELRGTGPRGPRGGDLHRPGRGPVDRSRPQIQDTRT